MEAEFAARVLLSLVAVAQGLGPMRADFNRTHATNPTWTSHARFHVVWQVLIQCGVSLVVLYLLWGRPEGFGVWIAVALCANWILTFFATVLAMPRFGGTLADADTGIRPFRFGLGDRRLEIDTNLFGACVLSVLVGLGAVLLWVGS